MEFKDCLKKCRRKKGLTQDALAHEIFVSRSAVAKWEAGLGIPADESVTALCEVLGVTREDLFPNKEAEPLLIEKNVKIKKRMVIVAVLAVTLAVSLSILVFLIIRNHLVAKEISAQTPTVTRVYFDEKRGDGEGVDYYDGQYIVYKGHHTYAYVEITVDARLVISSLQIEFENTDVFTCSLQGETFNDGTTKKLLYKVPFRIRDGSTTELRIATATYSFYDRADSNRHKTKSCNVTTQPIPISVSNTNIASVTLKFNAHTVMTFNVKKGESIHDGVFSLGKQEFLIQHLMETNYSHLLEYLTFEGWERADGVDLYEPVYGDVIVNACVKLKPDVKINLTAKDLQFSVFDSAYPSFLLDGQSYDNVKYTLNEQSNCVEIGKNCEIKGVKPGTATVTAEYDLGFYSGSVQFDVTITENVFINVLGYRKYITPNGGSYYTGVKGIYDYDTGRTMLTNEAQRELTEYFDKQNQDFLSATGVERRLVELKWVSNTQIIPVFETEYEFDLNGIEIFFQIGSNHIKVDDIKSITVRVDDIARMDYGYKSFEGNEMEFSCYYISNGDYVEKDGITLEISEVTICVVACIIKDGVYYYLQEWRIPVILTE